MKFKIPEIKIPKLGRKKSAAPDEESTNEELPDEEVSYDEYDAHDEAEETAEQENTEEVAAPREAQGGGLVISESQLRMIWAGEIVFAITMVVASFIIAFAN